MKPSPLGHPSNLILLKWVTNCFASLEPYQLFFMCRGNTAFRLFGRRRACACIFGEISSFPWHLCGESSHQLPINISLLYVLKMNDLNGVKKKESLSGGECLLAWSSARVCRQLWTLCCLCLINLIMIGHHHTCSVSFTSFQLGFILVCKRTCVWHHRCHHDFNKECTLYL